MKKILLGTTAFLVASVAMAAEAPKATVGGAFKAALQSNSITGSNGDGKAPSRQAPGDTGWGVQQAGGGNEIHVSANGKTDSGLAYGAKLEHRFIGGASTDEAWISFSDSWGKLVLGRDGSPAGDNAIGGQSVLAGTGGWDGDTGIAGNLGNGASSSFSGKDAKVIYSLPSIAGLDVGVSIAPSGGSQATADAPIASAYRNALEASVSYSADLGGAKLSVGGTYAQAKNNINTGSTATGGSAVRGAQETDFHNHRGYTYGAKVAVGAFSIAAGHTNHGKGGINKDTRNQITVGSATNRGTQNSIGVGYDLGGGTTVGLGYAAAKSALKAGTNDKNVTFKSSTASSFWTAGVTTAVAPGLSVFGEFNTISGNDGKVVNGGYRGNEVLVGTSISF